MDPKKYLHLFYALPILTLLATFEEILFTVPEADFVVYKPADSRVTATLHQERIILATNPRVKQIILWNHTDSCLHQENQYKVPWLQDDRRAESSSSSSSTEPAGTETDARHSDS